jgi:AcrR family transcriptional regulator
MKSLRRKAIGNFIDAMALRCGHHHHRRMGLLSKGEGLTAVHETRCGDVGVTWTQRDWRESGLAVSGDPEERRRYDGTRRQADAEARHRRIVTEATTLFLSQGFGATSIGQIAMAADVSTQTVYATYGSKAGVLARAIDVALAGDWDDTKVIDRIPTFDEVRDPSGAARFVEYAGIIRALNARVAPLIRVMEQSASTDPALEALRGRLIETIQAYCRQWIDQLGIGALRPGLSAQHAASVMAMIESPYVYSVFTIDADWTPEQYEKWLAHALPHLLLRPDLLTE